MRLRPFLLSLAFIIQIPESAFAGNHRVVVIYDTVEPMNAGAAPANGTEPISFSAFPDEKKTLTGWTEYDVSTCKVIDVGSWSATTVPTHGQWEQGVEVRTVQAPDCGTRNWQFQFAYYTWTDKNKDAKQDPFSLVWKTSDGEYQNPGDWVADLSPMKISSPSKNDTFALADGNFTKSGGVPFSAHSYDKKTTLNWSIALNYATTKGGCAFNDQRSPTSAPDDTTNEKYDGMGGKLAVSVTQGAFSDSIEAFIIGSLIPHDTVTNQLVSLYSGGATPHLLTGIAEEETGGLYQEFISTKVDGVSVLWPIANGCHVGLMQYGPPNPFSETITWNWLANTKAGAGIFAGDLRVSDAHEKWLRKHNPQLGPLSATQREDNALCYYKNGTALKESYWLPSADGTKWIRSTGCLNDGGKNYADVARADIQ